MRVVLDDDVEARVAEDTWHVGSYGLIWFAHPYGVETDGRYWRGTCACGWRGPYFLHKIGAELDAEWHPMHAPYGETR